MEPAINALPTLWFERGREHARRLMRGEAAGRKRARLACRPAIAIKTWPTSPGCARPTARRSSGIMFPRLPSGRGAHRKEGRDRHRQVEHAGVRRRRSTFNEVFGRTRNPWNTALTSGGSTGGGAAALAAGEVWLAHGSDHAGSLRRPATYCSVVGLRPSAGRVTRGTSNNLFAPLSVQGPMARNVADVALFLDAMVGLCPRDPLTFEAPGVSFAIAVAAPVAPRRVAFTADFGGKVPVDREVREFCAAAVRRFEDLGAVVEEASPDLGKTAEAFLALRSQHYVVDRELMLQTHRDLIKPDIVWNTEFGLEQSPSQIAAAERERAALFRRCAQFFDAWDLLVTPGASTPAFDVNLRMPAAIDGKSSSIISPPH